MIESTVVSLGYLALAAFRAAEPARWTAETGFELPLRRTEWTRACRATGLTLLVATVAFGWGALGRFDGILLASAATMTSTIVWVLGAPLAPRIVWTAAASAAVATPLSLIVVAL